MSLCYDRVMYDTNISQQLQDHCNGRDMYILVPRQCNEDEANDDETEEPDEGIDRWTA